MAASEFAFKSASETAAALGSKAISSVELTQMTIDRIEKYDTQINAVCVRDFSRALAAARAADAAIARGERKPLLGIPMTIKGSSGGYELPHWLEDRTALMLAEPIEREFGGLVAT